jgi:uncharacterized phage-associated protein
MQPWFNIRKAAQVSAYFALKQGGAINVLKLTKLIYLADRLFMERYDAPLLDDELVSMDHGPVNSMTYDCINGNQADRSDWNEFVADRSPFAYSIGVAPGVTVERLDELSRADRQVLDETWRSFGRMTQWEIRDYTHKNCPEWENPQGSSHPIPYERVFKFLGKEDHAAELAEAVRQDRVVTRALAA